MIQSFRLGFELFVELMPMFYSVLRPLLIYSLGDLTHDRMDLFVSSCSAPNSCRCMKDKYFTIFTNYNTSIYNLSGMYLQYVNCLLSVKVCKAYYALSL